jgi:phosphatidylserine/phosphatidylglycerophosphate/cardiolipin synthase-like enzyme
MSIICKLGAAAVVVAIAATGCSQLPQLGAPRTTPPGGVVDAQYTLIQEPDAGYAPIVALIDGARKSVRMTMYALNDPAIEQALINAHTQRGVETKIVLDRAYHGQVTNQSAYDRLKSAGLHVVWAPAATIVHEKAIVIDDATAVVSTANLNARYYATGRDAIVVTTNPVQVSAIAATVDGDYDAAPSGRLSPAVDAPGLVWSPAARSVFLESIDSATTNLEITSEEFKDRAVITAITHAAARHVRCRIVLNAELQSSAPVQAVQRAGCTVHVLPETADGLYMHEKVVLVDRKSLLIGSHNMSTMSLIENRELSLQLDADDAPKIVDAVAAEFDNDFEKASPA